MAMDRRTKGLQKQEQAEGFVFQAEGAGALRGGVAVMGQVQAGALRPGARAVCVPAGGESFLCCVADIAQPDPAREGQYLHPAEVRADGPGGGRCALFIPGKSAFDFCAGDRLVPVGAAPLDEPQVMLPKPCRGFLLHIRRILGLPGEGTAVSGMVLNGSVRPGDRVSFGHVPGEAVFDCTVRAAEGTFAAGTDCTLTLDEPESRRFRAGQYLFIL